MQTGQLDQIIELQYPMPSNDSGEIVMAYRPLVEVVWAFILSGGGSEAFEAARTNARETIRVKMRFRDDVLTTWRFIWEKQIYNITTVDRSKRRDGELWLTGQLVGAL